MYGILDPVDASIYFVYTFTPFKYVKLVYTGIGVSLKKEQKQEFHN